MSIRHRRRDRRARNVVIVGGRRRLFGRRRFLRGARNFVFVRR